VSRGRLSLAALAVAAVGAVALGAVLRPGRLRPLEAQWRAIHTPGAGLDVGVPAPVLAIDRELAVLGARDYRMSPRLLRHLEDVHRLFESAWPMRLSDTAELTAGFADELRGDPACTVVWSNEEMAVGRCRP
jgi:hypothetical protein